MPYVQNDPTYSEIDSANLESVRDEVVWNEFFVGYPFLDELRRSGVAEPYLGGAGMTEPILYGTAQGMAVDPAQTVTLVRQQITDKLKFVEKGYSSYFAYSDWEMGPNGGVINSGPSRIFDLYSIFLSTCMQNINTMLEMDAFRHGQSQSTTVNDDRHKASNGLDEALNNGIDTSLWGNRYMSYGQQLRNGAIGKAINVTPYYLGQPNYGTSSSAPATSGPGQIDFKSLLHLGQQSRMWGGNPKLGITNLFGFEAIATALQAYYRDVQHDNHDIKWQSLNFNGTEIHQDPLAPSAVAQYYIPINGTSGATSNTQLKDGVGSNTATIAYQTPQFYSSSNAPLNFSPTNSKLPSNAIIQPSEAVYYLDPSTFKLRTTNNEEWNFGTRMTKQYDSVSMNAVYLKLATNLYCCQPNKNAYAYGFAA
jgi:hypothetical protein